MPLTLVQFVQLCFLIGGGVFLTLEVSGQPAVPGETARLSIHPEVLNEVDDRLFGQFMEVASWGEPGPDSIVNETTGELPAEVIEHLAWMQIPVIRWPGGTDVDAIDWTDRIDGAPGRGGGPRVPTQVGGNTLSNRMSHDAFLGLCEQLGAQPMMVLNLKDLLVGKRAREEATQHAAAFVAYCNVATDADVPEQWLAWAKLRERNGRKEPWGVPYFQIGNEGFLYLQQVARGAGYEDPAAQAAWLADHVVAMAQAMKAVDPAIQIIYDGNLGGGLEFTGLFYADPRIQSLIDFATLHSYYPMNDYAVHRDDEPVDADDLTLEQLWYLWQFGPGHWEGDDMYASAPGWRVAQIQGPLAHTEWNWNGWGDKLGVNRHPREVAVASGVAAAAHLNSMIRQGDRFKIGNQSMLVGTKWNINAIRVDPAGKHPPFLTSTGRATGLYSRLHGNQRLAVQVESMPRTQVVAEFDVRAYGNARSPGSPAFPLLDVVATADPDHVYLHIAHRSYESATPLVVDLNALGISSAAAQVHLITAREKSSEERVAAPVLDAVEYGVVESAVEDGVFEFDLPAGAVVIVAILRH